MFLFKPSCRHEKITAGIKSGYCPDCGEYVENRWFMAKCPCCGKKHKTVFKFGKPVPLEKFCKNCGCKEFIVEELDYPDVVTINYATYSKHVVKRKAESFINAWVESTSRLNLLPLIPA